MFREHSTFQWFSPVITMTCLREREREKLATKKKTDNEVGKEKGEERELEKREKAIEY